MSEPPVYFTLQPRREECGAFYSVPPMRAVMCTCVSDPGHRGDHMGFDLRGRVHTWPLNPLEALAAAVDRALDQERIR